MSEQISISRKELEAERRSKPIDFNDPNGIDKWFAEQCTEIGRIAAEQGNLVRTLICEQIEARTRLAELDSQLDAIAEVSRAIANSSFTVLDK